jgi:hypothetical protein
MKKNKYIIFATENPSSKFRVSQLSPHCDVYFRKTQPYPKKKGLTSRIKWYLSAAIETAYLALKFRNRVIIQNKFSSKYPILELMYKNIIYDIDDRIWEKGFQRYLFKILLSRAQSIVVANKNIERIVKIYNQNTTIIETPIPYIYKNLGDNCDKSYIYWCVQSGGVKYISKKWIELIEYIGLPLKIVMERLPTKAEKKYLNGIKVEYGVWTGGEEDNKNIINSAVTIMPLDRSSECLFKSSFKALCSLKAETKVIVSPVGYNRNLLNDKDNVISIIEEKEVINKFIYEKYVKNLEVEKILKRHSSENFINLYRGILL